MTPKDCEFHLNGMTLRGRRWGDEGGMSVLALHGWLDNCASFDFLVPLMLAPDPKKYDIVALDLAGHGLSDRRSGMSAYNIWQDIIELLLVTEQLGWTEFALMGHSRGAMISMLFAATYPEKITHLAAIEGLLPGTATEEQAPAQLRMALEGIRSSFHKPSNYHASLDAAVKARERGFMPLIHPDALALAKRAVRQSEKGFYWCYDPKLLAPSEIKLTPGQVKAFVDEFHKQYPDPAPPGQKPVAVFIVGNTGILDWFSDSIETLKNYPGIKVEHLEGGHHLHMSVGASAVSQVILDYFQP